MYVFKNALKSITRSKGRNILIGIIITVIATSSCIALSIKNAANKLMESYKSSYDVEATLTLNRSEMRGEAKKQKQESQTTTQDFMSSIPELNMEMVQDYGNSNVVKNYSYTIQTNLNASNIEKVSSEETNNPMGNMPGNRKQEGIDNKVTGDFTIKGYSSLDAMTEFVNGTYQITSGSIFNIDSTEKECVISEELAEQNNLSVGSEMVLQNPNNSEESYSFKVTGIYSDSSDTNEFSMFSNAANQILTSYNALNEIAQKSNEKEDSKLVLQTNATFHLNSADDIETFEKELTEKGLSSYYTVSTNIEALNESLQPIENLSTFANVFLILVLSIGGVVLVVVNMINIRERKYEIGVLRAIGMKKHTVLEQFVIELFCVTFVAIVIGTAIGSVATVPIANAMLQNEITAEQESKSKVSENFGMKGDPASGGSGGKMQPIPGGNDQGDIRNTFAQDSQVEYIDKINAVIDVKTVLELVLIGILLTIMSSSIAMISISRYTPLKILSNRT